MLERLAGARVVVTGGAGFLGSHLCERLLDLGAAHVTAIDNLLTGDLANLTHLFGHEGFRFLNHDVTDYLHVPGEVTHILHFASPASPIDYLELPIQTLKVGALGTHKALGLARAKNATFMLASTSEVYGDPQVHPQPETYWGHVNPIGPRGVYDEAKRFAEALTYAYHRSHAVDVRVPRIFNSVLAGERLLFDDGDQLHVIRAEEVLPTVGRPDERGEVLLRDVCVPTVSHDGHGAVADARWYVAHPTSQDCFEVTVRYGRTLRVTGDHSIFVRGDDGRLHPRPVRDLTTEDHVALSRRIDVPVRDRQVFDLVELFREVVDPWRIRVVSPRLGVALEDRTSDAVTAIVRQRRRSGGDPSRQSVHGTVVGMRRSGRLPLGLLDALGIDPPHDAMVGVWSPGRTSSLPRFVHVDEDLLWLLGLIVAEGHVADNQPKTTALVVSCEGDLLDRAAKVLEGRLNLYCSRTSASPERVGAVRCNSLPLVWFLSAIGMHGPDKRIPGWVLGLPLDRLGHFMEGYREGDGVHSGRKFDAQERHEFSTTSEGLRDDLVVALGRFGIVASVGRYETTLRQRTGDRRYPFHRVTVSHVEPWSPLEWHHGVKQKLQSRVEGDVVWAKVRSVEQVRATPLVYDFCVPGPERFVTASGILAHNTFGPVMRPDDGRAVPTFIGQALRGEPITIHGDGSQTRSLIHVDDQVEGLLRLLASDWTQPCNIGNPHEVSICELAETIRDLCGSDSEIVSIPRPVDDPSVRQPDITVATRELDGWTPQVGLPDGLANTIEWFRKRLVLD